MWFVDWCCKGWIPMRGMMVIFISLSVGWLSQCDNSEWIVSFADLNLVRNGILNSCHFVILRKEEGGWWSAVGIIYSFVFPCSLCSLSSHQFYEFRLILRDSLVSVLNVVVPWVIWRQELYPYTTIIIAAFIIQTCVTYITHSFPPWQSQGSNVLTSTMSANFLIVQQFQFSYNYLQKNRFFHTFLPPLPNHPLPYFPTLINLTRLTHLHNPSHLQIFLVAFHFLLHVMDEPTVFVFDPQQEGNRVVAFVKSICILVIRLELSIRVCWYPFW